MGFIFVVLMFFFYSGSNVFCFIVVFCGVNVFCFCGINVSCFIMALIFFVLLWC